MEACIFCDIVAGTAPASMLYVDATVCSFLTIGPINPGHLLVIPRQHLASLAELDEQTTAHLFTVAMKMAAALRRSGLRCEGVNLFLADGEAAFQDVFHVHMHVSPRFVGDSFRIEADWSLHPTRAELDAVAAQIRMSL
jgi:histidine triad (HIT) family protein